MFSHSSRPNRRPRSYPTYKIPFAFFRSRTLCGMRMGPRRYSAWVSVVRVSSNISQSFGIRSGGRNLRSVNATISGGRMRMLSSMVKGRNRPSTVSMASRPNCTFGVRNHSMNEPSGRMTFLLSTDSCCIAAPGYSPIACCRRASSLTTETGITSPESATMDGVPINPNFANAILFASTRRAPVVFSDRQFSGSWWCIPC